MSFGEIIVIALVGLAVLKPADLRYILQIKKYLLDFVDTIKSSFESNLCNSEYENYKNDK